MLKQFIGLLPPSHCPGTSGDGQEEQRGISSSHGHDGSGYALLSVSSPVALGVHDSTHEPHDAANACQPRVPQAAHQQGDQVEGQQFQSILMCPLVTVEHRVLFRGHLRVLDVELLPHATDAHCLPKVERKRQRGQEHDEAVTRIDFKLHLAFI